MTPRTRALAEPRRGRVVALVGPRLVGEATLARRLVGPDARRCLDLEDPASPGRLGKPMTVRHDGAERRL